MPIGIPELIVILVIALVVFGPKKIPEIANALGKSINEFKKGSRELETSFRKELEPGDDRPAMHDRVDAARDISTPSEAAQTDRINK